MKTKMAPAFVLLALAVLVFGGVPRPALANSFQTVSKASGDLLTLSQQITQNTLLVALEVNRSENMTKLGTHMESFLQLISALRGGDKALGLSGQWPPVLDTQLRHIQKLSGDLAAIVKQGQEAAAVSPEQVQAVAGLDIMLRDAVANFQKDYRTNSPTGEVYSLYLQTLDVGRQQGILSQKMFKEFLFVAYEFYAGDNQKNLNRSYSLLDRSFQALIHGDSELQLIPAPNPDVERHWNNAREIWIGFRPIIKQVARTGAVEGAQIIEVAARNQQLLTAITNAVDAY